MNNSAVISHISKWMKAYAEKSGCKGFVIGISGGIDSAVTSTLCALTGMPVLTLEMPIYQAESQVNRAQEHISWLTNKYPAVSSQRIDLTPVFDQFMASVPKATNEELLDLALANTRARLRMSALYYFAGLNRMLVAGTGNKVEDFGVGFFTKYGDGGVDLSPIADLTKTEVFELAAYMGIVSSIQKAAPTDGLWGDDRSDEDQIGASYPELEWAMAFSSKNFQFDRSKIIKDTAIIEKLSERQKTVLDIYIRMHNVNTHKVDPIPICLIPPDLKET